MVLTITPPMLSLVAVVVFVAAAAIFRPRMKSSQLDAPLHLADEISSIQRRCAEYCQAGRRILEQGHAKFKDQCWSYDTYDGRKLVVPLSMLDELKSHPKFSFKASIDNDMLLEYTRFGGPPDYFTRTILTGLNPTLSKYTPIFHAIIRRSVDELMGDCPDWTELTIHELITKVIMRATSRAFYGSAVMDSQDWREISYGYLNSVIHFIILLKAWPPWLRPVVNYFVPHRKAIQEQFAKAMVLVAETCELRAQSGGGPLDSPPSMMDHLTTGKNSQHANDVETQTLHQMTLVAVGNSTTASTAVQAVYDVIDNPDFIDDLRADIQAQPRDSAGNLSKQSLDSMRLLDSFFKESMRLNAAALTTFQRANTADVTLKNGLFVPKGTKIEAATCAIDRDESVYPEPLRFDAWRFARMRQKEQHENKHTFVSVGLNDLGWGFGRHACPGRFLSDIVDKLVLVELLCRYDLRFPAGHTRPRNEEFENVAEPSTTAIVMVRSRQTE